jgi:toxin CcdB
MAQFSVHPDPKNAGYLLNVQTDILDRLTTRQVIPLRRVGSVPASLPRLNPVFEIEGRSYALLPQFQGAIATKQLNPATSSLHEQRGEIIAAIDFLVHGY